MKKFRFFSTFPLVDLKKVDLFELENNPSWKKLMSKLLLWPNPTWKLKGLQGLDPKKLEIQLNSSSSVEFWVRKLKKADEGCKDLFKGQWVKWWKINDFFSLLQSLGVNYYEKSVFLHSKVNKAKKAVPLAKKAKLQISTSIDSKSLS